MDCPIGWTAAPEDAAELSEQIVSALFSSGVEVPRFAEVFREVVGDRAPPFAAPSSGALFRERASEPGWLARSLVINAKKEAEGAQVLWKMVGEVASELVARNVHQHAVDESNHAQYYVKILQWTFPGCAEGEVEQALQQISPRYSLRETPQRRTPPDPIEVTLDEMVQMNIGEIRTRVHQLLLWPAVLEHCPPEHLKKVRGLISTLLRDETRHIAYTAQILEQAIAAGRASSVRDRMAERFEQFCDLTRTELGGARFEGS